jgi:hypothetical protein
MAAPEVRPQVRRRRSGVASIAVGDQVPEAAQQDRESAQAEAPDVAGAVAGSPVPPGPDAPETAPGPAAVAAPEQAAVGHEAADGAPAIRESRPVALVPGPAVYRPSTPADLQVRQAGLVDELLNLGESARRSPGDWESYSPNLRGDVNEALKAWVSETAIGTGNFTIAKNHCLHAALSRMPLDARGMIDLTLAAQAGRDWLADHPGHGSPSSRGGQSSVGKQLAVRLRILGKQLPTVQPKIELWAVLSAYVQQFMDDNPPPAPEL